MAKIPSPCSKGRCEFFAVSRWVNPRKSLSKKGRYKASLVQDDRYLLTCQKYIELNPVRAGMVAAPGDYRYSSYACNVSRAVKPLSLLIIAASVRPTTFYCFENNLAKKHRDLAIGGLTFKRYLSKSA